MQNTKIKSKLMLKIRTLRNTTSSLEIMFYKWSTAFEPAFYIVTRVDGSSIVARRITDGRNVYRDSSQFKLANALIGDDSDQEIRSQGTELNHADWRQGILMNAGSHAEAEETT